MADGNGNSGQHDGATADAAEVKGLSDLAVRLSSAIVMVVIVVGALWLGGLFWTAFVLLVAAFVLWEWNRILRSSDISTMEELAWLSFGGIYVGGAAFALIGTRASDGALGLFLMYVLPIIAVDVGAYFSGRAIGGPRIAKSISPSKTWAGLVGGALAAGMVAIVVEVADIGPGAALPGINALAVVLALLAGSVIAVIAQAGDFFESWMKRRAGVKDSSGLIPGHGGVFDRVDGFLAVFFVVFLVSTVSGMLGANA